MFSGETREYIRDVASNVDRIIDMLDNFKELCASVSDIYTSEQDHRNNQTMYALSIMSAVILPHFDSILIVLDLLAVDFLGWSLRNEL